MGFTSRGLIPGTNGSGELSFVVSFVVIGDTGCGSPSKTVILCRSLTQCKSVEHCNTHHKFCVAKSLMEVCLSFYTDSNLIQNKANIYMAYSIFDLNTLQPAVYQLS